MNGRRCRESLVPYLEKVPGAPVAEIERHLSGCVACRSAIVNFTNGEFWYEPRPRELARKEHAQ